MMTLVKQRKFYRTGMDSRESQFRRSLTVKRNRKVIAADAGFLVLLLFTCLVVGDSATVLVSSRDRNGANAKAKLKECSHANQSEPVPGMFCNFETKCDWKWQPASGHKPGFQITTGRKVNDKLLALGHIYAATGPVEDALNQTTGHFLLLSIEEIVNQSVVYHLESPWYQQSDESCYMEAKYHMYNMDDASFKLVLKTQNHSTWVPMSILGNKRNTWENLKQNIGKSRQRFQIILEISSRWKNPSHFAIDDIRLVDCFPSPESCNKTCSSDEFQCSNNMCIKRNQLCDFYKDCLHGEDEEQNCDRAPENTTCNFESGWCGWTNISKDNITWELRNSPSTSAYTGPQYDHTYENSSGHYLVVDMKKKDQMLTRAVLLSPVFAPPPAYHRNVSSPYFSSCQLRFFYHMFGQHIGSLDVEVILVKPTKSKPTRFWEISNSQGNKWNRVSSSLPKIDSKYRLQITASRAIRGAAGDIAIDDISLSPECSNNGIGIYEKGYDWQTLLNAPDPPDNDTQNITKYTFTTCNNTGRYGPTQEQCVAAYNGSSLSSSVNIDSDFPGVQIWSIPQTNHYTLIAKGASGGRGAIINERTSHGAIVKVTLFLRKGEKLYVIVGQEGTGASNCEQNQNSTLNGSRKCLRKSTSSLLADRGRMVRAPSKNIISELSKINKLGGGGGGGGGATFVYKMDGNKPLLLLAAGGGGGLAYNSSVSISPDGRETNVSAHPQSGSTQQNGAGGGGGWDGAIVTVQVNMDGLNGVDRYRDTTDRHSNESTKWISAGMSVISGRGIGGQPCMSSKEWGSYGGFGGGGGGCEAGGGGGGYQGGHAHVSLSSNGEGGVSYIVKGGLYPSAESGVHNGPGELVAISAIPGCSNCEHMCVLLDDFRSRFACVCPENWILTEDGTSCREKESTVPAIYLIIMITIGVLIFLVVGILCFCLYNRYQRQKVALIRRKVLGGPELQLSRLRAQSGPGGVLTEYNPNYEFGGETYTLTDLKEIPRENLRLVKALGQGAFGEVYQGFYKHRAGDAVEMPVAVKTLPELSSNQAEMDFLMEALIMSKFNHPNIVHFIGVCFDKHPRFIILELLAGGDLKTFLRESRPKPERASPLTMKDLLLCALDVAKGCKYLEENHFIHRDIAARNCLLTTKGPGRVVKIADFGMARDIYRADYYKKGGKAMLPVKWMPPEAFLDGIFTSKTDVWSYGVLLWEVLSLGYMPYPGRGNQDVMQLVTNGGRLEPPTNCPTPVYGIMTQCWHPIPEDRPTFTTLLERVGYCLQDPEVVNAPLPVFQRPPSSERDVTLMRPPNPDDSSCLRIVHGHRFSNATTISTEPTSPNSSTADYLVPLTPYSFSSATAASNAPAVVNDSTVSSPTEKNAATPIPDSQSTSTLLDDEESPPVVNKKQSIHSNESNSQSASTANAGKRNGIENGVTLNPVSLDKSRRPAPYVNVGVKKTIDRSDEEIRC